MPLDEPVLTEVVLGCRMAGRSFMCGELSERLEPARELDFAAGLLTEVVRGLPRERLGLHVCRGNRTRDDSRGARRCRMKPDGRAFPKSSQCQKRGIWKVPSPSTGEG